MVRSISKKEANTNRKMLVTYSNPESEIAEQFRTLRTNLQFATSGKDTRSILVTSPEHHVGNTTTIVNLAVSLAQQKQKVLLIDANLKTPTLHNIFKINNDTGLTEVLIGKCTLKETVIRSEIGRLEVLTSGPIPFNSSELLQSSEMKYVLENAYNQYNIILIDSPPLLDTSYVKVLANQCDGVLLVIKSGKTEADKAVEAQRLLVRAQAKLLGIVLNDK